MKNLLNVSTKGIDTNDALLMLQDSKTLSKLNTSEILAIARLAQGAQKNEIAALKPSDSPFKLASLFIAKKDVRYYLNYIYADGKHLYGSNGHILIRIKHQCESGYYNALGITQDIDFKYPDLSKFLDTVGMDAENVVDPFETKDFELIKNGKKAIRFKRFNFEGSDRGYDLDYLNLAKRANARSYFLQRDSKTTLYFVGRGFDGVILPIRI